AAPPGTRILNEPVAQPAAAADARCCVAAVRSWQDVVAPRHPARAAEPQAVRRLGLCMSNRALAAAVFRAWGVMWALIVMIGLPQLLNSLIRRGGVWSDESVQRYVTSSQAIAVGCEVILVVFLIRKADWLASLVFPVEEPLSLSIDGTA